VDVWARDRIEVSYEVTDHHQAFYLDGECHIQVSALSSLSKHLEYLSTLTFSPSETALLYTAEANDTQNNSHDPYAKFRYRPNFGEGFGGKKHPHFFLLRWRASKDPNILTLKPTLYEIHPKIDNVLFGQGIFFQNSGETTLFATGYELTPNGRMLGIKGCFNRPFGVWELRLEAQSEDVYASTDDKKGDLIICSARKISDTNSGRSPRILQEGTKNTLYWFSSAAGGPHVSTTSLHSVDIMSLDAIPPKISSITRTVIPIPEASGSDFPGLYPPFNLLVRPFLQQKDGSADIVIQSQWGARTTILSVSSSTGIVKHLTPPDPCRSFKTTFYRLF